MPLIGLINGGLKTHSQLRYSLSVSLIASACLGASAATLDPVYRWLLAGS